MPRLLLLTSLVLATLIVGCAYPNQFRNVRSDLPHATLTTDNPPGFRGFFSLGRDIKPFFINKQPTAFWRIGTTFRIPVGVTTIDVIDASEPYEYEPMQFTAVGGGRYTIRPTRIDNRDAVTISERLAHAQAEHVIASAFRRTKVKEAQ